ncbi:MAG: hypothetical protein IPG72_01155 [Ardenticatenales bacterium]|jgi:hypothetical protein|nr:hypothetical protein [Ardenticatenales bacterium]
MNTHPHDLPVMTERNPRDPHSRRRRTWLAAAAATALAAGIVGGWTTRDVAAHAPLQRYYPPYPRNPYPPSYPPYPCYQCPPGYIYYPSGCATPFAPPPPEMTSLPIPPGVTMPPPIGTAPATATAPLPPAPPPGAGIPTPTPGGAAAGIEYKVCPQKQYDVPKVIQDQAMAEPWTIYGYGMKRNPNVPYHPLYNSYRHWLSTQNMNMPYSVCNPAIWKAGCP